MALYRRFTYSRPMSNFVGMDVAEIRDVAKRFNANAEQIATIVKRLDQLLVRASGTWFGKDSAGFRQQWTGVYRGQLEATRSSLADMGLAATRNADEQDRASDADAGDGQGSAAGVPVSPGAQRVAALQQDLAYAKLVDAAGSEHPTLPPGYTEVSQHDLKDLGLTGYKTNGVTGMDVSVYRDDAGHYVVAFPGSSTGTSSIRAIYGSAMDWVVNDISGAVGVSPQEVQAAAIARAITSHVGADNVTFAGHSLGGQNAAVAALVSGSHAVTFNAAAISSPASDIPGVRDRADGLITNYQTSNDPLSNSEKYVLGNKSVGTVVVVPGTGNSFDAGSNHGLAAVEDGIRSEIDKAGKVR